MRCSMVFVWTRREREREREREEGGGQVGRRGQCSVKGAKKRIMGEE